MARIEVVPLLPEHGRRVTRWPVIVVVHGDERDHPIITPRLEVAHGRVVQIEPSNAPLKAGGRALFFVQVELAAQFLRATVAVSLPALDVFEVTTELPLGIDLCDLPWELWHQGAESRLEEVRAIPGEDAGPWQPIQMPRGWPESGVTWVRTQFTAVESWQTEGLRFMMRAGGVDAAFLNGVEVGRTTERGLPRNYALPQELVRWGQENALYLAVENPHPPISIPPYHSLRSTPMQIIAGALPATCRLQAEFVPQVEAERLPGRPIGGRRGAEGREQAVSTPDVHPSTAGSELHSPRPLRKMTVRRGVLCYEDGGEVALWGENIYPQSYDEYRSLVALGINPRQAVEDDLDDFAASGIEAIRIHVFDSEITDSKGNLIVNDHLDVLDYLVAACNRRGIYLWLTPIAWWSSPQARPDALSRQTPKQAMTLWPATWRAQRNYLRQFLQHENPYTGHRLVDEPCLVLFEIMNEPLYWSFPQVMGKEPITLSEDGSNDPNLKRALAGVRRTFHRFAPSVQWRVPQVFAYWRYDTLRRYIDTMVETMRAAGATQPIAYSHHHAGYPCSDVELALADSRCDALTTWTYPGGFELEPVNDDRNLLSEVPAVPLDRRLAGKARLVYEFDAPGLVRSCYLYPALARYWRQIGVQVACQFQYDPTALAAMNPAWETHYLNLWHTPEKWVSYMIAGEVFRRLKRGMAFATPPDDQIIGPAAVSFRHNTALLCAEDCYMQARPTTGDSTPWQPLPLPESPTRIVTVGSCPYYEYEGTGVVMLQVQGDEATLRICPDVQRTQPPLGQRPGLRGTAEKPLTRLSATAHLFHLHLKGWDGATVERQQEDGWERVESASAPGTAAAFSAWEGLYRLRR